MDQIPQPPTQPPSFSTPAPPPGMFGTKIPSSIAFVVGILLFLLPFAEIKCSGTKMMSNTGLNIATGGKWKAESGLTNNDQEAELKSKTEKDKMGNAQYFAIAALGLGILGLLFSFSNTRTAGSTGILMGVLSAAALIGVMLEIKKWFNNGIAKSDMQKAQDGMDNLGLNKIGDSIANKFTLDFTPWFYIAIVAFLAAAFFSYWRMRTTKS
jgi:hypothetical protein